MCNDGALYYAYIIVGTLDDARMHMGIPLTLYDAYIHKGPHHCLPVIDDESGRGIGICRRGARMHLLLILCDNHRYICHNLHNFVG